MHALPLLPVAGRPDISYATGHRQLKTRFRLVPSWLRTPRMVEGSWGTAYAQRAYTPTSRPGLAYNHNQHRRPGTACSACPIHQPRFGQVPTPPKQELAGHSQCIFRGWQACVVFPHAPDDRPASIRGPVDRTTAHARSCQSFRRSSLRSVAGSVDRTTYIALQRRCRVRLQPDPRSATRPLFPAHAKSWG